MDGTPPARITAKPAIRCSHPAVTRSHHTGVAKLCMNVSWTIDINNIPDDVLALIFEACCSQNQKIHPWRRAPLVLLRVCRRWNSLALQLPSIWAQIHPHFMHPASIDLWLQRSQNQDLSLYSSLIHPLDDTVLASRRMDAFKRFMQEVHRWKSLDFTLGIVQASMLINVLQNNVASRLSILALNIADCPDQVSTLAQLVSERCPNLSVLDLTSPQADAEVFAQFPIDRVNELTLHGRFLFASKVFMILEKCTKARQISICGINVGPAREYDRPPIVLDCLHSLALDCLRSPVALISKLRIPNIKHLKVVVEEFGVKRAYHQDVGHCFQEATSKLASPSHRDTASMDPEDVFHPRSQ